MIAASSNDSTSTQPVSQVLVVDDDQGVREMLSEMLAEAGFGVLAAGDGSVALDIAASQHVDLAIVDLVMPEKEGLETIRALRANSPTTKIIAMSGIFQGKILKSAEAFGANLTIEKPIRVSDLLTTVRSLLEN